MPQERSYDNELAHSYWKALSLFTISFNNIDRMWDTFHWLSAYIHNIILSLKDEHSFYGCLSTHFMGAPGSLSNLAKGTPDPWKWLACMNSYVNCVMRSFSLYIPIPPSVCDLALFNLFMSSVNFYICSIQNTDGIIQTHILIWRPRAGSSKRFVIF